MYLVRGSILLVSVLALFVAATAGPVLAANSTQHLVQMPIAVDKAAEAGVPETALNRMTEAMNRGELAPEEFNNTLRNTPDFSARVGSITTIGDFVVARVNDGLRGEELANAIQQRLREEGIPVGDQDDVGPPPVARNFMPSDARDKVNQATPDRNIERDRRDRDMRDRRRQRPSTGAGAAGGTSGGGIGTGAGGGPPSGAGR